MKNTIPKLVLRCLIQRKENDERKRNERESKECTKETRKRKETIFPLF